MMYKEWVNNYLHEPWLTALSFDPRDTGLKGHRICYNPIIIYIHNRFPYPHR